MKRRVFGIATVFSGALLGITVLLWFAGVWLNPWDHHLSVSSDLHIGIWGRGLDSQLVIFNDDEYGPYRGSIISVSGGEPDDKPRLEHEVSFGDTWGIYYRFFRWPDATLWTLMVSLWYPTALFGACPIVWGVCRLFRHAD